MKRWLPLLLTLALALGCAGCARRQTVTVYRIAKEGAALMETETITVPDGTDPVQVMIDALGAAPGDSTCFNPVRRWLTLGGYRIDDAGTLWLTVTSSDTASGIARKAAVSMMSCYGADPYTLRAAIGPSIGKCCFETDSDVADAFFALLDPAMDERIEKRGDKYHIDLKAINRLWLLRAGIDPSRIDVHPDCTKCHPERYWSHRAMGDRRGGMAAMICLTEDAL